MQEKALITAITNQKGGVLKSTTAENLGIGLARKGKRVPLVDMDPQASLTIALGWIIKAAAVVSTTAAE